MAAPFRLSFELPFADALEQATARARAGGIVLPSVYYSDAHQDMRRATFTVSYLSSLAQIEEVHTSLQEALRSGESFAEWKRKALATNWGLKPGHLETVFRTNVQTAYAQGQWRQFLEAKSFRPFLIYSAVNDSRTRPAHAAMHGYVAHISDPIWKQWTPPCGYNCRCTLISLNEKQALARGLGKRPAPPVRPDPGFGGGDPEALVLSNLDEATRQRLAKLDPMLRGKIPAPPPTTPIAKQPPKPAPPPPPPPAPKAAPAPAPAPGAPQPVGVPVSKALQWSPVKAPLAAKKADAKFAVDLIDKLHGDGALPAIPLRIKSLGAGRNGHYDPRMMSRELAISSRASTPRMTTAHEIGHFLDHKGWGSPLAYSSEREFAFQPVRRAIEASPEFKALQTLVKNPPPGHAAHLYYLNQWREIWARAYAQWVQHRSGDVIMASELANVRTTVMYGNVKQWDPQNFEPIAQAIDQLFTLLGWRK